jgi:acetyltransferase-like isoleucine patch superfamily enzyme
MLMANHKSGDRSYKDKLKKARTSPFSTYKEMTVGNSTMWSFLLNEFAATFINPLPGALGIVLRKFFLPLLIKECKKGFVVGRSVTIRHPKKLAIGRNVTIDDLVVIDARGHVDEGVKIGNNVSINRNCVLKAKNGAIRIGDYTNIGGNTAIISNSGINIGESVLIAGGCQINAGGYAIDDVSTSMSSKGVFSKGPITIGNDVWIGAGAIILDAVTIGSHAIVGAGAVVNKDVPEFGIVGGVPARLIRLRG